MARDLVRAYHDVGDDQIRSFLMEITLFLFIVWMVLEWSMNGGK